MRSQMALDWIAREQETIGIISAELRMADHELETARIGGRELRFPKEKKDILMLAASQMSSTSESSTWFDILQLLFRVPTVVEFLAEIFFKGGKVSENILVSVTYKVFFRVCQLEIWILVPLLNFCFDLVFKNVLCLSKSD